MQKIVKIVSFGLPVIVCLLLAAQFLLSNDLASAGETVYVTNEEIDAIRNENEFLRQQVAVAQSLAVIEKKAAELGFAQPNKFVTIHAEQPVALR